MNASEILLMALAVIGVDRLVQAVAELILGGASPWPHAGYCEQRAAGVYFQPAAIYRAKPKPGSLQDSLLPLLIMPADKPGSRLATPVKGLAGISHPGLLTGVAAPMIYRARPALLRQTSHPDHFFGVASYD